MQVSCAMSADLLGGSAGGLLASRVLMEFAASTLSAIPVMPCLMRFRLSFTSPPASPPMKKCSEDAGFPDPTEHAISECPYCTS